jgi:type II secretory pathway pseudopilin PulG
MVAILVFGIIVAVSVPAFSRFMASHRLKADMDMFAQAMLRARSSAVTKNTNAVFKFQMADGTYYYFEDLDGDGVRDSNEYQSSIHELSPGVSFDNYTLSGPILVFQSRGNANEGGTITLSNVRGQQRTVSIFGGTGNIDFD